ncbi:triose-phosphate isomerase [Phycicoccus sp. BSK3Z-2]|uniref:Triosephosphate isomerase n=2 Tax=Phycicoccus avicenniae TaxID=2828860 RepID=A0A941D9K7_9MICO|nr:triose-phosphate isomerase [Phycicoccus avicenniae]
MSMTLASARAWVAEVTDRPLPPGVDAFVLPPHTALAAVAGAVPSGHGLRVGAQDAHWDDGPEWTGEVSVAQVADAGAGIVEVGHSERRIGLGEDDGVVAAKLRAVLDGGLTPLLCVGESAGRRREGRALEHLTDQLASALRGLDGEEVRRVVLAYEPVWSIGAGGTPATPDDVAPVVAHLRRTGSALTDADPLAVLYGGGVDTANADVLLDTGVDGLFVGRAAWSAAGFRRLLGVVADRVARDGGRSALPGLGAVR